MQVKLECFKSAVAFFFLFFLHETFKRRTELSHIAYNRLLTAMVIEMKNEISQTVRHCQAQAIINKLKDEHTL